MSLFICLVVMVLFRHQYNEMFWQVSHSDITFPACFMPLLSNCSPAFFFVASNRICFLFLLDLNINSLILFLSTLLLWYFIHYFHVIPFLNVIHYLYFIHYFYFIHYVYVIPFFNCINYFYFICYFYFINLFYFILFVPFIFNLDSLTLFLSVIYKYYNI